MASGEANEFLIFTLGKEEYGIEVLEVQEIRGYDAVTKIANAPEFLKGVGQPARHDRAGGGHAHQVQPRQRRIQPVHRVIILNLIGRVVGMVVDSISDVITLAPEQVRPAPDFSSNFDTKYILGLGTLDQRMLILVDIEKLMTSGDMALVGSADGAESKLH